MATTRRRKVTPLKDVKGAQHELAKIYKESRQYPEDVDVPLYGKQIHNLNVLIASFQKEREIQLEERLTKLEEKIHGQ